MENSTTSEQSSRERIAVIATRVGLSEDAIGVLLQALRAGNFKMAQFNHAELGGMGQWSGGMLMIGAMSDSELKSRVKRACEALVESASDLSTDLSTASVTKGERSSGDELQGSSAKPQWWPDKLGTVSSSGSQNDSRYAYFSQSKRLAIMHDGDVAIYDTGKYEIFGVAQQQGGLSTLTFSTQLGNITTADLSSASS